MKKFSFCFLFFLLTISMWGQNVGIGTTSPVHNLHIRSFYDTTLYIQNDGSFFVPSDPGTRLGILNKITSKTAGSRIGILTNVAFPQGQNGEDLYIGHEIRMDGFCPNWPQGCNDSEVYGLKSYIPATSTVGDHYAVYGDAIAGYGGYFKGKGYFSSDLGLGIEPSGNERFFAYTADHNRAARFFVYQPNATAADVEGIQVSSNGNSSDENFGGRFISTGNDGITYGLFSQVNANGGGFSYGLKVNNISNEGNRTGVYSDVSGNGGSSMTGMRSIITGNAGANNATALWGTVNSGTTTGYSYAMYAANFNSSPNSFAGFFSGRSQMVSGDDASYTSHGYLQLGRTTETNVVFDNNEILARNNGAPASLFVQADGGDVLLCGNELGGVGIGVISSATMPAGYLLAVDGKGIFEELIVKVSENWPDYVFEKEYEMMSLGELKKFIQSNKHLPNIPTAEKVHNEGIALGEMQRKMMEKIEELTLYIIELEERLQKVEDK